QMPFQKAHKISTNSTSDAAIVHLVDLLVGFDDQIIIDADLPKYVDDDGVALAIAFGENAVKERRLACTKKAAEHGHGDLGVGCLQLIGHLCQSFFFFAFQGGEIALLLA